VIAFTELTVSTEDRRETPHWGDPVMNYHEIYRLMAPYTVQTHEPSYHVNLELARDAAQVKGAFVECGVWKGGMIAGVAAMLGPARDYWLFDSFQGLPPPGPLDDWPRGAQASPEELKVDATWAKEAMALAKIPSYHIVAGWFETTLPEAKFPDGIAYLRLDGDYYESTWDILVNLFSQVNDRGIVVVDDYYFFEGCARALHDYLSFNQCPERIQERGGVCYLRKGKRVGPD
jgi:O-methyltransferase